MPAEIIVQSEQPTGSLSDKDAAELAKSGVATQLVPYTDVIVQGGTTTICTLAFANTPVQKVQLPSTLTTIRYGAFQNCTALKQITLPESMTFIEGGSIPKLQRTFFNFGSAECNISWCKCIFWLYKPYICDIAAGNYKN